MFLRLTGIVAFVFFQCTAVFAGPAEDLMTALKLPEIIDVMRQEGIEQGNDMAADLFPDGPNASWTRAVDRAYNAKSMTDVVSKAFAKELGETDVSPILTFLNGNDGRKLVSLEISARLSMIDPAIEDAAKDAAKDILKSKSERAKVIADFIEANDLIDANVQGALNAQLMFYRGLIDGDALDVSDDDIMAEVWSARDDTRTQTVEWVNGFLHMAYGPLPDDVIVTYTDLSRTEAGQKVNTALFAGFDAMFAQISYDLGRAAADILQQQDL